MSGTAEPATAGGEATPAVPAAPAPPPSRRRGRSRKKKHPEPSSPPDLQSTTVGDILAGMKRRSGGIPMPSSVARNAERRKRRRAGMDPDAVSEAPSAAPSAAASAPESDRTDTVVAPQVTIDEDGNIVVDQDSLVVNAGVTVNAERESGAVTTVENLAMGAQVTSASYAKRETPIKWEEAETEKFFEALRLFGADFSLMEHIFPSRTRKQLKLKFKREERNDGEKIDWAMRNRLPGGAEILKEFAEAAKRAAREKEEKDKGETGAEGEDGPVVEGEGEEVEDS